MGVRGLAPGTRVSKNPGMQGFYFGVLRQGVVFLWYAGGNLCGQGKAVLKIAAHVAYPT